MVIWGQGLWTLMKGGVQDAQNILLPEGMTGQWRQAGDESVTKRTLTQGYCNISLTTERQQVFITLWAGE